MTTKHERMERFGKYKPGWNKRGTSGYAAYRGAAKAWCYLCNVEHTKAEHDAMKEK